MKFAVGYQLAEEEEEPFVHLVRDFRDHIEEVYFPWADMPSGRAPLNTRRGYTDWGAQEYLEHELEALKGMGIKLDLLFNANCYGRLAASQYLENQVVSLLDYLGQKVGGVDIVTTTSPAVARTVTRNFPDADVRASVNMRIGTVKGMQTRFHLYTVPGQSYYNASRKLVLQGVDGVIFVADSQITRLDENVESYLNLWDNLLGQGDDLGKLGFVIQMNKRDLTDIFSVEDLNELLNHTGSPVIESSAVTGQGVFETLKVVCKQVIAKTG